MSEAELDTLANYLNNQLSAAERLALEQRLATDGALRAELANLQQVRSVAARSRLLAQARQQHEASIAAFGTEPVRRLGWGRWATSVAAACLLVVAYLRLSDVSYLTISEIERGTSKTATAPSPLSQFETGLAQLQQGAYDAALPRLRQTQLDTSLTAYYRDAARWYEVVALAHTNKPLARQRLNAIDADPAFAYPIPIADRLRVRLRVWY
ncbi:hypothetical protein [Fibrella aestuarina]|uniref:hypothetical protein n=1 Tax=Fibrella aestuarina TaxID=651143 RepID=UPI00059E1284|nr:hypothetical protein [Fibrella aestuarina]